MATVDMGERIRMGLLRACNIIHRDSIDTVIPQSDTVNDKVRIIGLFGLLAAVMYAARSYASSPESFSIWHEQGDGFVPANQLIPDTVDVSDYPTYPEYQQPENEVPMSSSGVNWKVNEYPKYAAMIADTERRLNIPADLLARLLYQESRYRPDVISGTNRSAVGAMGIAQFMPATAAEMHVDPLDPMAAIDAGGRYLKKMYDMFGDWSYALMAYNAGPGNIKAYIQTGKNAYGRPLKQETLDYVAQITADVPVA